MFVIQREEKFGGRISFGTYKELEEAYQKDQIYPLDLKIGVAEELNRVSSSAYLAVNKAG